LTNPLDAAPKWRTTDRGPGVSEQHFWERLMAIERFRAGGELFSVRKMRQRLG